MEREQFTFYASFAQAIQKIRNKQARCDAYDAIINFALYGTEPEQNKLSDAAEIVFMMARPVLESGKRKAEAGKTGGKTKQTDSKEKSEANDKQEKIESKPEANDKQTGSKKEDNKEGEDKKEKENKCYITPLTPRRKQEEVSIVFGGDMPDLQDAVMAWIRYKTERRESYGETGLKALLTRIKNAADQYGEEAVVDVINRTMSANYQGIVFDWLKERKQKTKSDTTNPFLQIYEEEFGT